MNESVGSDYFLKLQLRVWTDLDPLQEEKETLKDVFQQLKPLRKRHHTHLVS